MKFNTLIFILLGCNVLTAQVFTQSNSGEKRVFINNETTINSEALEYSPAFYEDGIVFISTRPVGRRYKIQDKRINQNIMSIFWAKRSSEGLLQTPVPFAEELLSSSHEGPVTFDRTADNIFFTRNNVKNGKGKKAKDGIVKMKIYTAQKVDGVWQNIEDLPFNDDESNTVHPAVSVEGDALYFSSDRPGGYGGMDIWVVYRRGGVWSDPENLGAQINSEEDEVFPFIHADGTLYFSSNGHAGHGGLDLFAAQNTNGKWSTPVNMGIPFNSEKDDFGLIIDRDKRNGYFSSSRPGGLGGDDIFSFHVIDKLDNMLGTAVNEPTYLSVLVSDASTGEMIDSALVTYAALDDKLIAEAINSVSADALDAAEILLRLPLNGNSASGITDSWGRYPIEMTPGSYVIVVSKPGFKTEQTFFNTASDYDEIFVNMKVKSETEDDKKPSVEPPPSADFPSTIKEGTVFQLPNIYYNFNDASIRPDAKIDLDALASFLTKFPDIEIEVSSHTDSRGGSRYNRQLSQKRAENAVKYLVSKGIDGSRMVPVGYGESQLRNKCSDGVVCTELEHQYNRRTEVKITKMDREINIEFIEGDEMLKDHIVLSQPKSETDREEQPKERENPKPDHEFKPVKNDTTEHVRLNESKGEFKVVAGVFGDMKNANKRLKVLKDLGYDSYLLPMDSNMHAVVVGDYPSRESAQSTADTLKREHKIRSYIKE